MTRSIVARGTDCLRRSLVAISLGSAAILNAGCAATAPQKTEVTASKPSQSSVLTRSFEEAVTRGDAAWSAGQADMAIYLYVQALSFRPRDVTTLGKLGSIEQAQGNLTLAATAFELAANENPSEPRLSGRLGLINLALGDEEKAWKWLRLSVDGGTTDWRVLDALSVIEARHGHYVDALQYSGEAVALAPGLAMPLLHRGQALHGTGNDVAAEDAARSVLRISNTPDAWRLLGEIQAKRRAYPASVDSFLQAMDAATAYNMTGKLAMDNGDNAAALRYFEKASVASPVYRTELQRNAAIARERLDSTVTQ